MGGETDRAPLTETPGKFAPPGTMLNARPIDNIAGHERGGQRPGLVEMTDAAGTPWGKLGESGVQVIAPIQRQASISGFTLGSSTGTHSIWESRLAGDLAANLYILRNKDATLELSRHTMIGDAVAFEDPTDRDLACVVWTGEAAVAGGVNENPFVTDLDSRVFKADYLAGEAENGFGSPAYTYFNNWDPGSSTYTTLGGPWPSEHCDIFYDHATLGNILFIGSSVVAVTVGMTAEPKTQGFVIAYDISGTAVYAPISGPSIQRPYGTTYNLHKASPVGSISTNPGATEVYDVQCVELGGKQYLFFCYAAIVDSEAGVGRYDVSNFANNGFSLNLGDSGFVQLNGATFAYKSNNYSVPTNPLEPHLLAKNYPRGCRPTSVSVDPLGYLYVTRSSTGWGPQEASEVGGLGPTLTVAMSHPDFAGATPITVVKIDPIGSQFEWESVTNVDPSEPYATRINSPELRTSACDGDAVYVAGREIGGANVFALRSEDGGVIWKWRSCAVGAGTFVNRVKIDPQSGNLWVAGGRTNTWQGNDSTYANIWLLDRVTGEVLKHHDLGPSTAILDFDINPVTGRIVVGSQATTT